VFAQNQIIVILFTLLHTHKLDQLDNLIYYFGVYLDYTLLFTEAKHSF